VLGDAIKSPPSDATDWEIDPATEAEEFVA
jgi:hypothetical protein